MSKFRDRLLSSERIFIIGVGGDSGSGKTTMTEAIKKMIGEDIVTSFSMDDYHKYDRKERRRLGITPLHPEANRLDLLEEHLAMLKKGKSVMKPVYNHRTGEFDEPEEFNPSPVIIVEGLLPFYTKTLRELIDFKVFVDPAREVKWKWKIRRDVGERGYKEEEVIREIREREPDYKQFIDFQKIYAEVVIKVRPTKFKEQEEDEEMYSVRVIQSQLNHIEDSILLRFDLSSMISLHEKPFAIEFFGGWYFNKKVGIITIDGLLHRRVFQSLVEEIVEFTGVGHDVIISRGKDRINAIDFGKILLCWYFLEKTDIEISKGYK